MRKSETMRAAPRLLLSHPIVCLLAALGAGVVLGVLGPLKVVHAANVIVEGEKFAKPPTGTIVVSDTLFSRGQALKFTADVTASHTDTVTCSTPCDVVLMARRAVWWHTLLQRERLYAAGHNHLEPGCTRALHVHELARRVQRNTGYR